MVRFDAYTATSCDFTHNQAYELLLAASGDAIVDTKQGRGFHLFENRLACKDDSGKEIGSVSWGGKHHAERVMLEVKGEHSPEVVKRLRAAYPHRCTRVDSCADFDAPRAFEGLYRRCKQVKRAHRIVGGKAGDWEDFPEKGRTLYLGATSSVARVRLYEKGKQREYEHLGLLNWARLEVEVRPAKDSKDAYASLSPLEVWGASRWTRELAGIVLREHVDPHPAGTVWRKSSDERALDWMCLQYGSALLRLLGDVGDWQSVGLSIGESVERQKRRLRND